MSIFNGTIDSDLLDGTPDADTIIGFAGKDTIFGRAGNDLLNGNQGDDTVKGGEGDDWVRGGQDNDELFGDAGNDTLHGDKGNDTAFGGDGDDLLFGDTGVEANFTGNGNDILYGGLGNDSLFGLAGNDQLLGSDGNDFFCGNKGNDIVFGEDGNDLIRGGQDDDLLFGGAGNDVIFGDLGADTVTGGEGEDTFVIGRRYDVPGFRTTGGLTIADADRIADFIKGQDLIELIGGLTFEELNIFNGSGTNIGNTIIQDKFTGEYLAILQGIDASNIGGTNFTPPGITPPSVGTLQFSAANFSINEDGTPVATITITRTDGSSGAIAVQVILNGGSAIGGSTPLAAPKDYDNSFITVNWSDGDTSPKTVTVPLFNDTEVEGNETVNLTLGFPTGGATIGTQNTAVLTIVDNDTQPIPGTLSFTSANYSDNEGNSGTPNKIVGTIQRTGGSDRTVTVQVQLGEGSTATPNDFTNNLPITVTFNAGETSKTVELPILGDTIPERDDTINLRLVNPTGGASLGTQQTATYTIVNDDIATDPEIEVLDGATNIADGTATAINFGTTTVNTPAIKTFTVKNIGNAALTLSGMNLPDGFSLVGNLPSSIAAASDATFQLQLNANATGNFNGTLQFTNNDSNENPFDFPIAGIVEPPPTVSITATDAEAAETGGNTGTFRITRTGSTGGALMVNLAIDASSTVTSNAGSAFPIDYNFSVSGGGSISGTGANRSLIIPAGQSFVDLTVTPANDEHAEADETLKLNLSSGSYTIDATNNNGIVTFAANDTVVINTNDSVDNYALREGSLRQAILNAIARLGDDTITFSGAATSGTINLAAPLPKIIGLANDLFIIDGPSTGSLTINGNNAYRIFHFDAVNVTINNLTITNGNANGNAAGGTTGGGIYNNFGGTLKLVNTTVSNNTSVGVGGGIRNDSSSTLIIINSTISGNSTIFGSGGGIYNSGTVTITNSTISGNTALFGGGGIFNSNGTVNVKNTIIAGNTASNSPDFGETLTSQGYNLIGNTSGTTITGNTTGNILNVSANLGALQNNGGFTQTIALLANSPAINAGDPNFTPPPDTDQRGTGFNRIQGGRLDIGAFESNLLPPATVSITATDEAAAEVGNNTGTFRITRTGNTAGDLTVNLAIDASSTVTSNAGSTFPIDYDFSVSGGGSISGTGANRTLVIPAGQSFVDLTVTPANDEHAEADETLKLNLASGSYTIDGTNNNAKITIIANDTVVINTNDSVDNYALREGSLRQAMLNAEALAGDDTITFSGAATSGTIDLTGALPNITQNLNLNGPGAINLTVRRDTGGDYRIFRVNSGDVTFDGLTIANGLLNDPAGDIGGGIANFGDGTVNVNNSIVSNNRVVLGGGGGIGNFGDGTVNVNNSIVSNNRVVLGGGGGIGGFGKGTINVNNSTFSNNQVETGVGGGIFSNDNGRVTVTNSTFSGNKAMGGGSGGAIDSESGKLMVTDSTFSNNEASLSGGSISASGAIAITNSTFSENKAGNYGGAIAYSGTLTLTNSIISNNEAFIGGGINSGTGNGTITNSIISNNIAREDGGAIHNRSNVTIDNSTIANNTAGRNAGGIYNNDASVNFTNSTLSGNAARGVGGGIFNLSGTINSDRSTIANNTADSDRNNTGTGGGIANEGGTVNAKNTIIAGNIDGLNIIGTDNPDFAGSLTSQGYNLIGNTTGTTITEITTGNILNVAANLGPLQDNGGSTQTMAILAGSPAINAGDPNFTPPPDTDQRGTGFNRVNGGRIDIGAFESNLLPAPTDLEVTQTVSNNAPLEGSNIIYTVQVTNNGGQNATGVQLTDLLPTGLIYVSDRSGGTYNPSSGIWNIGNLNNAASTTLNITARVAPGTLGTTITNNAEVAASGQTDPNPSNNQSNLNITVVGRKILNPTPAAIDRFGDKVAISGNSVLIGAHLDDTGATDAGSAYLFDATTGALRQTLNNPTPAAGDEFGDDVAISGNSALVGAWRDDTGATDAGSAYLFDVATGSLTRTLNNPTPAFGDLFGTPSAVAIDGNNVLIGTTFKGEAYLFNATTGALVRTFNDPNPVFQDTFGDTAAISGNKVLISDYWDDTGANNAGSAYLFDATTGALLRTFNNPTPAADDWFGTALAVSDNYVLIGAFFDDTGATNTGAAYLFDANTGALLRTFTNPTPGPDDAFGSRSVAISGNNILIGAYNDDTGATDAGSAYLFDATTGALLRTFNNPNPVFGDTFGYSVGIDGNKVLIGAPGDDTGANVAGAAYQFLI